MVDLLRLSRRAFLDAATGCTVSSLFPSHAAALAEGPPPLDNGRRQFTILQPSKMLPSVDLRDLKGRKRTVAPVDGKVMLVNLWATWCGACRADLPLLERFGESAADWASVVTVPTDTADPSKVGRFLDQLALRKLPVFLDPDRRLASETAESNTPLSVYGMPITYVINASGRISGYILGATDWLSAEGQGLLRYYASNLSPQ